ncbi:nitroreductase/quinone reductase family protein [Amycolatopsis sp. H20-H5]|uniref:nitroreductase/quinone reductase family protein n=1 Tax=Amycolatopsis sp. H20-H5 TaxID=3046309 RepID=UPI002DC029C7|nr:nitroreductase/quinone reductase family protein [Amycolatopsis sp. H20-H5]MEC3974241.1 nitroreductase/quinone reductase family protein [Amycolatopsis sp. H20-H5]
MACSAVFPVNDKPVRTLSVLGSLGDDFVVLASKGGTDEDPAWLKNLRSEPSVGVHVGTHPFAVLAGVASSAESEPLRSQMSPLHELLVKIPDQAAGWRLHMPVTLQRRGPATCSARAFVGAADEGLDSGSDPRLGFVALSARRRPGPASRTPTSRSGPTVSNAALPH